MNKLFLYLKNFDWLLFSSVFLLLSFGLAEIYSITLSHGELDFLNFKKQVFFILLGIFLLFLFAFLDYHFLKNSSIYLYLIGVIVLIGVLIFGVEIRGTKGWFYFGNFGIQPVEFAKIILIIFLARFFSSFSAKIRPLKHLILSGVGSFILIFLILMQPDFGSSMLLLGVWFLMIFFAGFKKKYFVFAIISIFIALSFAWVFAFKEYQKERIITFLNPSHGSLEESWNVTQAIIAIGAGGYMGRGIGFGSQSQLKFLPEAQNDFIFAVIAEELGFLGVCLTLLFFGIFFTRCLLSLKKINNDFAIFFILGAMGLIFIEMFINIGMNMGILPVIGISLPFVSYGGSSIISSLILVGIVESIIIRSRINY